MFQISKLRRDKKSLHPEVCKEFDPVTVRGVYSGLSSQGDTVFSSFCQHNSPQSWFIPWTATGFSVITYHQCTSQTAWTSQGTYKGYITARRHRVLPETTLSFELRGLDREASTQCRMLDRWCTDGPSWFPHQRDQRQKREVSWLADKGQLVLRGFGAKLL